MTIICRGGGLSKTAEMSEGSVGLGKTDTPEGKAPWAAVSLDSRDSLIENRRSSGEKRFAGDCQSGESGESGETMAHAVPFAALVVLWGSVV